MEILFFIVIWNNQEKNNTDKLLDSFEFDDLYVSTYYQKRSKKYIYTYKDVVVLLSEHDEDD